LPRQRGENEFTFVGIDPEEVTSHFGGQTFYRLDNGNVLMYDGGSGNGTRSSQVHEYKLDEDNKTAEHVWSYIPDSGIYGLHGGNAQRLPNGNTFIGWGGDGSRDGPACTEVTPEGKKVFELFFDDPNVESYRAYRFPLLKDIKGVSIIRQFLGIGDNRFKDSKVDTGITIRINGFTGSGYNSIGVRRMPLAPLYPTFEDQAPLILPVRVQVGASGITTINGRISFDVASFDLKNPDMFTIYRRDPEGPGPFTALATSYDPATNQLQADMTEFGEFVIGKPDLEQVALAPILITPKSEGTVNEALPVALDWTPRGFVSSYHLQVSSDAEFSTLLIDDPNLKETPYILETVEPNTTYYWRVCTINEAGPSDWSEDIFETVPPTIRVKVPNGGEQWQRGIEYFIQWEDNLVEDVVIDLYKGDSWLQTIDTVPSTGAYKWKSSLMLEPGEDYSIQVRSLMDEIIADMSDTTFTIK
jgi:hypothetical protein